MSKITVRAATRADQAHIAAWNAAMAWETEAKRLDPETLERGVLAIFDEPRRGFYLVAEHDGSPVGCLMVTYEWSDWRCGDFWWIQSVYVIESARRLGVFRALYEDVASRAKAARAVGLRLYVETENERAQATYAGLGMERCHYFMYEAEFSREAL
jgi:GNAT superfamily N-acetyltransferase